MNYRITEQHAVRRAPRSLQDCFSPVSIRRVRRGVTAAIKRSKPSYGSSNGDDPKEKARALENAVKILNSKHGPGTVMLKGQTPVGVRMFSTGCLTLDIALGGGFPRGRIVEIYGPESSGKTTLAYHAIAEMQRVGGKSLFVDAEHAYDSVYAQAVGVNMDELLVHQPDYGEQAFDVVEELVRSGSIDLVVVDSVAALTPKAEIEGEYTQQTMALQARMMSQAMRRLSGQLSKTNCTLIFLNQLRSKVGVVYGNPETTTGGNSLKYYASQRIDLRKKESLEEGTGADRQVRAIKVRARAVKNKVASPFREAMFDIVLGKGIDNLGCIVDAAEMSGIITRRGSYYFWGEERLAQGRDKLLAAVQENQDLYQRLETAVKQKPTTDSGTITETEGYDEDDVLDEDDLDGDLP